MADEKSNVPAIEFVPADSPREDLSVDSPKPEKWFKRYEKTILCTAGVVAAIAGVVMAAGVIIHAFTWQTLTRNSYEAQIDAHAESIRTDLRRLEDRIQFLENSTHPHFINRFAE